MFLSGCFSFPTSSQLRDLSCLNQTQVHSKMVGNCFGCLAEQLAPGLQCWDLPGATPLILEAMICFAEMRSDGISSFPKIALCNKTRIISQSMKSCHFLRLLEKWGIILPSCAIWPLESTEGCTGDKSHREDLCSKMKALLQIYFCLLQRFIFV